MPTWATAKSPPGGRSPSVAQETPALPTPALEYALDGDAELRAIERELASAEAAHDGHRVGELHARLHEIGGYGAPARAAALLSRPRASPTATSRGPCPTSPAAGACGSTSRRR